MVYSAVSDDVGTVSQFTRRKRIKLSHVGAITAYQRLLDIDYESAMQAGFDDIRFTTDDGEHIPYWIQSKVDSTSADVFIKYDQADGDTDVYMYYGNPTLSSGEDADNVFDFWFGAESQSEFDSKFTVSSGTNYAISGGNLEIYSTSGGTQTKVVSDISISINSIIEARVRGSSTDMQTCSYVGLQSGQAVSFSNAIIGYSEGGTTNDNQSFHYSKRNDVSSQVANLNLNNVTLWHVYKIVWAPGHSYYYQDGSLIHHKTDNIPSVDMSIRVSNGANQLGGETMYHDWFRARKYTTTEPTYTIGKEEHQRRNPQIY